MKSVGEETAQPHLIQLLIPNARMGPGPEWVLSRHLLGRMDEHNMGYRCQMLTVKIIYK